MTGLQRVERKDPLLWPVVHIEFTVLSEDRPTLLGHVCVCVCFFLFLQERREKTLPGFCWESFPEIA